MARNAKTKVGYGSDGLEGVRKMTRDGVADERRDKALLVASIAL